MPPATTAARPRGRPPKQPGLDDLFGDGIQNLLHQATSERQDDLAACATDPVRFVETYIRWKPEQGPTDYQLDILDHLPRRRRVVLRSPHGVGKSATAAWAILWFALTSEALETDWKVVSTAGAWRQLTKYLWPEVHKWARQLDWRALGRKPFNQQTELLSLSLKLDYGEAFAVASDHAELIEGAHATRILYLFDEAKAIDASIFDAAEGAISAGGAEVAYAFALSTPGLPIGRFYELNVRRTQYADWWVRHVSAVEAIAAGRLDPQALMDRKRQWGENHPLYRNRMLGEFATDSTEGVIPMSWIEAAQERWQAWADLKDGTDAAERKANNDNAQIVLGVDVARQGDDRTAIAIRQGQIVTKVDPYPRGDTMQTTGYVVQLLEHLPGALAVVDVIGVGAGVVDRLREQSCPVEAFNASERAPGPDKTGELTFLNLRAWAYWSFRELLDPTQEGGATVALPPDEELLEDLTAPRWAPTSAGRIQIEDKKDIRKRLGRSPDKGDAVVMACVGAELESLVQFF